MSATAGAVSGRAEVLGCAIDRLDLAATVERCDEAIRRRTPVQQVSVNVAKLVALRADPLLREIVGRCAIVNADGQAIVWAARLLGDPLPARVAGIDLMFALLALAERRGYRVFILGARTEVLALALVRLREMYPRIEIAGARHGYFDDAERPVVRDEIAGAHPDILFVAMSSPRKEYFLDGAGEALGVPLRMGVGGAIDVIAGLTRRAPPVVQRLGLEWLVRLVQEPRRLWRRYLVTNTRFALLLVRALARRAWSRIVGWPPAVANR